MDEEGVPLQRDPHREEGRVAKERHIQPYEKSKKREREKGELWEDREKKEGETETRRKTEGWRGSSEAE